MLPLNQIIHLIFKPNFYPLFSPKDGHSIEAVQLCIFYIIIIRQMELPIGNFFQVTINSNKLFSFMEEIMRKVDMQEAKVDEIARRLGSGSSLDEKLKNLESSLMVQMQKVKKLGQQDANYLKLFVRDVDKKASEKMSELQGAIGQLSHKINTSKAALQQDFAIKLSYLQKKISNLPSVSEAEQKMSAEIAKLSLKLNKMQQINERSQKNLELHLRKNIETNQYIIDKLNRHDIQVPKMQLQNCASIAGSFREVDSRSHSKRKKSKHNDTLFQQLQGLGSSIAQKIDDLQEKINEKAPQIGQGRNVRRSIISNNKVVKYHDNLNKVNQKSAFSNKNQNKIKALQTNLLEKLGKIQELCVSRVSTIEKQLFKQTNKSEIIDEHIGILSRKIQKQKARINEVSDSVRVSNDKKVDEKAIQNIKNAIKKMSKQLQQALESKVQIDTYERQRNKLMLKIQDIADSVNEKADKAQVKKGLAFFQQKLKEVIIVVAQQKGGNQDGAIKKTPFKCLSCDKDLEIQKIQALSGNTRLNKENSAGNLRNMTSQMRKRIRLINNTVSTVNGQD